MLSATLLVHPPLFDIDHYTWFFENVKRFRALLLLYFCDIRSIDHSPRPPCLSLRSMGTIVPHPGPLASAFAGFRYAFRQLYNSADTRGSVARSKILGFFEASTLGVVFRLISDIMVPP